MKLIVSTNAYAAAMALPNNTQKVHRHFSLRFHWDGSQVRLQARKMANQIFYTTISNGTAAASCNLNTTNICFTSELAFESKLKNVQKYLVG